MKARFPGTCKECNNPWYKDAEIARWLGSWVHDGCRTQAVATKRSEGNVTTLPVQRGTTERWGQDRQVMRPGVGHTRGIKPL